MSDTSIPSIRLSQQDTGALGILRNSVNFFYGTASHYQSLFVLPGRNDSDGLQVDIAAVYGSGQRNRALMRSADAPTGVLGLGWEFPISRITLSGGHGEPRASWEYSMETDGMSAALIREPENPLLFKIPQSQWRTFLKDAAEGAKLPAAILDIFNKTGTAVSDSAYFHGGTDPSRTLVDDVLKREFTLTQEADSICVRCGGESYQTSPYQFWRVIYYPRYERWSVVKETGCEYSFGDDDGGIIWEVGHTDGTEERYAVGWNRTRMYSRFGEYVSLTYESVMQPVKDGGKTYTKACYLSAITDAFGRTAKFTYGEKIYNGALGGNREYADPHRAVPSLTPNGYQDRYETKYLQSIALFAPDGTPLFSLVFRFGFTGIGETYKRLLAGYDIVSPDGAVMPGPEFVYHDSGNAGALKKTVWPSGGTVEYNYKQVSLNACKRINVMKPPPAMPKGAKPGVWFGPDYAVCVWNDYLSNKTAVQLTSWAGRWSTWREPGIILQESKGVDFSTLNVIAAQDYAAILYNTAAETKLFIFRKDPARPFEWISAKTGPSGAPEPYCVFALKEGKTEFAAGQSYIIARQHNGSAGTFRTITWNWYTRDWVLRTRQYSGKELLAVGTKYYLTLSTKGRLECYTLGRDFEWLLSGTRDLGFSQDDISRISLTVSQSVAAVSHLRSAQGESSTKYDLYLTRMGTSASLNLMKTDKFSFSDYRKNGQWRPTVVTSTFAAVAGNLLRYDGSVWNTTSLKPESPAESGSVYYAYGEDFAVLTRLGYGKPKAWFTSYTPNSGWRNKAIEIAGFTSPEYRADTANRPFVSQNAVVIGSRAYFRGDTQQWDEVFTRGEYTDLEALLNTTSGERYQINSLAFSNQAPEFLVCSLFKITKSKTGTAAAVFTMKNGKISGGAKILDNRKIWTPDEKTGVQSGLYPFGPSMFASYPSDADVFTDAGEITLYKYAAEAVEGPITDWPVDSITIDDGTGNPLKTAYSRDLSAAAASFDGRAVKYSKTTVTPGGGKMGSTEYDYINGYDMNTSEYYALMDGLLRSRTEKDGSGKIITRDENVWTAFTRVSDWDVKSGKNVCGAYVLQTETKLLRDGVSNSKLVSYAGGGCDYPVNGLTKRTQTACVTASGKKETQILDTQYAYEFYAEARAQHLLSGVASEKTSVNGVTVKHKAAAYRGYPGRLTANTQNLEMEAEFDRFTGNGDFPFESYSKNRKIPDGWRRRLAALSMNRTGTADASLDAEETNRCTFFSDKLSLPLAAINGAAADECAWAGFSSYTGIAPPWKLSGKTEFIEKSFFGDRSLSLGAGASISATLKRRADKPPYTVGIRYFSAAQRAITLSDGSRFALPPTGGQWEYCTFLVNPASGLSDIGIKTENTGGVFYIDSLFIAPSDAELQAKQWNTGTMAVSAEMDIGGRVMRTLFDEFGYEIGSAYESAEAVKLEYHSAYNKGGTYPFNTKTKMTFAGGGRAEYFYNGDDWSGRWNPGQKNLWTQKNGCLCKDSATGDSLTWKYEGDSIAVFMECVKAPKSRMSISVGNDVFIIWEPGGWSLTDSKGTIVQRPLFQTNDTSKLMLTVSAGTLVFTAGGRVVFSTGIKKAAGGYIRYDTGQNAVKIRNLISGYKPRLSIEYLDGAERTRQIHQLWDGDSRVSETVYDGMGRTAAVTKIAPAAFGNGKKYAAMQWRGTFVDTADFLKTYETNAEMRGDVADYYSATDKSYPYSGYRYDRLSLERVSEEGAPGALRSIGVGKSTKKTYSASSASQVVPAGAFLAQSAVLPDGSISIVYRDMLDRDAGGELRDKTGKRVSAITKEYGAELISGEAYTTQTIRYPNSHLGPNPGAYTGKAYVDALGLLRKWADSDTGVSEYICDRRGKLRFSRTAADKDCFTYSRYDTQGRVIEEGKAYLPWDAKVLAEKACDRQYPAAPLNTVIHKKYRYGSGERPYDTGKLVSVTTYNAPPRGMTGEETVIVTEQWRYNGRGAVETAFLSVSGKETFETSITYKYNASGDITEMIYPKGSPAERVTFTYNDQGRLSEIGADNIPGAIVKYTWTANGQIESAVKGPLAERWERDSDGNTTLHSIASGGKTLHEQEFIYSAANTVEKRVTKNGGETVTEDFEYDAQRRLTQVRRGDKSEDIVYDPNGNILSAKVNGHIVKAATEPETNRLSAVTLDGKPMQISFGADGSAVRRDGATIEYGEISRAPGAVYDGKKAVRLVRGSRDQLVMQRSGGKSEYIFSGSGALPLLIQTDGVPRIFIWGPEGLTAAYDGIRGLRYPFCDDTATIWAVFNGQGGQTAQFGYHPFGAIAFRKGAESETAWPFLFHGKRTVGDFELYDAGKRLYDPILMRFLSPDSARQYASPYVFCGNNPLILIDPDGSISLWARIGLIALFAVVAIAGIAITVATAGAATPGVLTAGVVAANILGGVIGGALTGIGVNAVIYTFTHSGDDFSWKDFGLEVAAGAASGAVTGLICGLGSVAINGIATSTVGTTLLKCVLTRVITNTASQFVSIPISNSITGKPYTGDQFMWAAIIGVGSGVASGLLTGFLECKKLPLEGGFDFLKEGSKTVIASRAADAIIDAMVGMFKSNAVATAVTTIIGAVVLSGAWTGIGFAIFDAQENG